MILKFTQFLLTLLSISGMMVSGIYSEVQAKPNMTTEECLTPKITSSSTSLFNADAYRPAIDKLLANKTLVLVGESLHGTHEIPSHHLSFIQFLVKNHGFKQVALEMEMNIAHALNQYIRLGSGEPKLILSQVNFAFGSQEILELVQWMRKYRLETKIPLELFGLDNQEAWLSSPQDEDAEYSPVKVLHDFAQFHDPQGTLLKKLTELEALRQPFLKAYIQNDLDTAEALLIEAKTISRSLEEYLQSTYLIEKMDKEQARWYRHNATMVRQSVEEMLEYPRDYSMAQNVKWILNQTSDQKLIVYAHDGHISKTGILSQSMGSYLKTAFGEKLLVLGTTVFQGKYTNKVFVKGKPTLGQFALDTPPSDSLQAILGKTRSPGLLLDLQQPCKDTESALQVNYELMGAGSNKASYRKLVLSAAFDAIFFIREVSPSQLL